MSNSVVKDMCFCGRSFINNATVGSNGTSTMGTNWTHLKITLCAFLEEIISIFNISINKVVQKLFTPNFNNFYLLQHSPFPNSPAACPIRPHMWGLMGQIHICIKCETSKIW